LHRAEHALTESLKLNPEALKDYQQHSKGSEHDAAIAAFGFTPAAVAGAVKAHDLDQFIESRVHDYAAHHTDTMGQLINLMGVRGARYAEHFADADAMTRRDRYISGVQGALPVQAEQEKLAEGPMQQFEQMLANFSNIGNTLATATLPAVNTALVGFNAALVATNDFLKSHETIAAAGGAGLLAAGGTALVGGAHWLWGGVRAGGRVLGGVGRGAVSAGESILGAGEEAAEAAPGMLRTATGLGLLTATSSAVHSELTGAGDQINAMVYGPAMAQHVHDRMQFGNLLSGIGTTPTTPAKTDNHFQVTVGPISMNGVADESTFHKLLDRISDSVKHALTTATGSAQGSDVSPFVYGAVP
jgi:hypothetical protein